MKPPDSRNWQLIYINALKQKASPEQRSIFDEMISSCVLALTCGFSSCSVLGIFVKVYISCTYAATWQQKLAADLY